MSDLKSTWGSWDAEWINRECQTASGSTHILLAIPPNQYRDRYLKSGHCFPAGASRDPEFACHTTSIKMPCLFFFFLFPRHENHYFDALTRLFQCLVKKKKNNNNSMNFLGAWNMTFLVKTRASVNDGWRWWDVMTMTIRVDKQEKKGRGRVWRPAKKKTEGEKKII